MDATETAAKIRSGEITAAAAVRGAIERALALQPSLNFLVSSDFERAMAKAAAPRQGPFAGVPFLIKDLKDYAGLPTRMGSRARLRAPPAAAQSAYMDALDRTGLVVIGKTATPEFGFLPTTEPLAFGATRNPWDPTRSAGGSSGGAAAAVASGIVPFAHASDGGGSIRIPASCCGLFGFKPSRGRMIGSRAEVNITDLSVDHVLTRSVRDSAAVFAATEDVGDGAQHPPVGMVVDPLRRRLRVGLVIDGPAGQPVSPEVRAAILDAGRLVESLGHRVIFARWPMGPTFTEDFTLLWAAGAQQAVGGTARALGRQPDAEVLEPFTLALANLLAQAPGGSLEAARDRLHVAALAYDPWFVGSQLDVIMSPVAGSVAPPLGHLDPRTGLRVMIDRLLAYVGHTPYHNLAGAPAMSVPLNWTAQNLPIGTQFAARVGHEALLFQLAYQLEAARPWTGRVPRVRAITYQIPVTLRSGT